jgi:hypothetical protein
MRSSVVGLRRSRGDQRRGSAVGPRTVRVRDRQGRRCRPTRSGRSFAEASQRVSVFAHDQRGCGGNAVAMLPASHELANRPAGCVLHGDAFGFSAFAERRLLAISEAKSHGHAADGVSSIPLNRRRMRRTRAPQSGVCALQHASVSTGRTTVVAVSSGPLPTTSISMQAGSETMMPPM